MTAQMQCFDINVADSMNRGGWVARPVVVTSELETVIRPHLRRAPAATHVLVWPADGDGVVEVSTQALETNYGLLRDIFGRWPHGPPAPKTIVRAWANVAVGCYKGRPDL